MDKIDRVIAKKFSDDGTQLMTFFDKLYPSDGFSTHPFSGASKIVIFLKMACRNAAGDLILNNNGNPTFKGGTQLYKYMDPDDFFIIKERVEKLFPHNISLCYKRLKAAGLGEDAKKLLCSLAKLNEVIFEEENLLPYDTCCNPKNSNEYLVTGIKITYNESEEKAITVQMTHSWCPKEKVGREYDLSKKKEFMTVSQKVDIASFKKMVYMTCDFISGMKLQAMSNYWFNRSQSVFDSTMEDD